METTRSALAIIDSAEHPLLKTSRRSISSVVPSGALWSLTKALLRSASDSRGDKREFSVGEHGSQVVAHVMRDEAYYAADGGQPFRLEQCFVRVWYLAAHPRRRVAWLSPFVGHSPATSRYGIAKAVGTHAVCQHSRGAVTMWWGKHERGAEQQVCHAEREYQPINLARGSMTIHEWLPYD